MGLFKSSPKQLPPPLPNLAIHLAHHQDHIFQPNDTITGYLTLSTPIAITPQAIEVSFWGHSKVWIRKSRSTSSSNNRSSTTDYYHFRDNAPLFTVTFNLLPEPRTLLADQTHNFPFSFRVPQGTGIDRSDCYQQPQDGRWTTRPHDLPPTFFFGRQLDWPDNAGISYGLTARLVRPGLGVGTGTGTGQGHPLSATAPVLFQPSNPHADPHGPLSVVRYTKPFTLRSSSLTGQEPSSIGFRKRIQDRFSSDTPKLEFEIGIELPDLLTSGAEFNFRTTFGVLDKGDGITHIPAIRFRIQKIELLDFTFFRAPRDWNARNTMSGDPWPGGELWTRSHYARQEEVVYRERKTVLNALPESQVVELAEVPAGEKKEMVQAQQCEHWFAARILGLTTPSFTSFAITRMYRVRVKLGVEIGEKKFVYEAEHHVRHLGSASKRMF